MNIFVVEQLLSGISHYSAYFTTSTVDLTAIESGPFLLKITFAHLSAANIYYRLFGELQERLPLTLQITTKSVIATHYNKYSELLEGRENQPIFDNDEVAREVEDARDGGHIRKEEAGDRRHIKEEDVGDKKYAREENTRDRGCIREVDGGHARERDGGHIEHAREGDGGYAGEGNVRGIGHARNIEEARHVGYKRDVRNPGDNEATKDGKKGNNKDTVDFDNGVTNQ